MMEEVSYRELAIETQRNYESLLIHLPMDKRKALHLYDLGDINSILAPLEGRPGAAVRTRSLLSRTFDYASDRGIVPAGYNPARLSHAPKLGTIRRFGTASLERALELVDGPLRIAMLIEDHTMLRTSDVVRLRGKHRKGDVFIIQQRKTGETIQAPISPELSSLLPELPSLEHHYVGLGLYPMRGAAIRDRWRRVRDKAGLPTSLKLHGIRKEGACQIAEGGGTEAELQAALGHSSPRAAIIYRREADSAHLAQAAHSKRRRA